MTNRTVDLEPKWRHNRAELTSGFNPRYMNRRDGQ
jgi:hydrogenase small subunit